MGRVISVALSAVMVLSLNACGSPKDAGTTAADTTATMAVDTTTTGETEVVAEAAKTAGIAKEDLKVGFIYIGDENEGRTVAHYAGAMSMKNALGLDDSQLIFKWLISEDEICYDATVDLVDQGCNITFDDSFGFESYMIQAVEEFPNVQFRHATGYQAKISGLPNIHNYFTSVYESHYVSGVAVGMKLNEIIADGTITENTVKIGYVSVFPHVEVTSGYTSFFLSVCSVCPSVTMNAIYTNSWANLDLEKEAAETLIADKCVLISQHADTTGAATACEAAGVPIVGHNISMIATASNWALTSASTNQGPCVTYTAESVANGETIMVDWCHGYAEGADKITELNEKTVAEGTAEKVKEVEDAIIAGTLHVSDTSTWTVDGKTHDSYEKDGDEYISDGYFYESEFASVPTFDIKTDGISDLAN